MMLEVLTRVAMVFGILWMASCSFDTSSTYVASDAPADDPDAQVDFSYLSYWSFDSDASDRTGAHDGSFVGSAAVSTGGQGFGGGEALVLSADGDRVDLGNPTTFDFNSDFTWHLYLKTSDDSGALLSRNPLASNWNQGSKALFVRNSRTQWDTGWVGNPNTDVVVNDDQWHQVIVTFEAETDALNILVDPEMGESIGDYTGTHEVDRFDEHMHLHNDGLAHSSFTIGQANFTGGLGSLDTLVGMIDEVAVFDRVLSGAELDQLIASGPQSF
jgi:hypothetical protein